VFSVTGSRVSMQNFKTVLQLQYDTSEQEVEEYAFVAKVTKPEITSFNQFCAAEISPTCYLKEKRPPSTDYEPVSLNRTFYYPLLYLYPLSARLPAINAIIGVDFTSTAEGAVSFKQWSDDRNTSVMTRRISLVTPSVNPYASYGLILSQVVYLASQPSELIGYTLVVLRLSTMIDSTLSSLGFAREDVAVTMFDTSEDGFSTVKANNVSLLYKEDVPLHNLIWQVSDINSSKTTSGQLNILSRRYTFFFEFSSRYNKSLRSALPYSIPLILTAAFLLIDLIAYLLWHTKQQRLKVLDGVRANQMLAYCSHELRNPLNIIRGMVDYTLRTLDDQPTPIEVCRSDLIVVVRTCDFVEHIVSDILVLQKLEEDNLEVEIQPCDLKSVLADIEESVAQKVEENKRVVLHMQCNDHIVLNTDEFRLKQVVLNLLTNAMKYTKVGTIIVEATIENPETVLITVKDTGIGIAEDKKHLIFQAHLQNDIRKIGRHGSYGLGLYLVHVLSRRMNWTVGFESVLGIGSTFWIRIPM
jgi:signal transduction histidine kinase